MSNKAKLYTKILTVVSKMEAVKESGYNAHQKYSYSTEEDLVNGIRQSLIDNKLLVLTSSETKEIVKITKGEKESLVTVVNTTHKFIDVETGEFEEVKSTGTGWDETDKGSFKAITGAMKYFISKNFLVPGKDDAENDGVTPRQSTTSAGPKTFNKPGVKTTTVQVTSSSANGEVKTEVKEVEVPAAPVDTSQVAEKFTPPAAKSFPRRTTLNKSAEPKF